VYPLKNMDILCNLDQIKLKGKRCISDMPIKKGPGHLKLFENINYNAVRTCIFLHFSDHGGTLWKIL